MREQVNERRQRTVRWAVLMALGLVVQGCALPTKDKPKAEPEASVRPPAAAQPTPAPVPEAATPVEPPAAEAVPVTETPVEAEPLAAPPPAAPASLPEVAKQAVAAPSEVVEVPADPHTFVVTLAPKDPHHPAFGKGHEIGFLVNGEPGKTLVLVRGQTYHFDVRTDVKHDFYLSTNLEGWGAGVYSKGVKGQFTYQGIVDFTPDEQTPDTLYYACRNHRSMGGKILIVDPGTDVAALERKLAEEAAQRAKAQADAAHLADEKAMDKAKQKIAYGHLLLRIKGGGIPAGDKARIEDTLKRAQAAYDEGHGVKALSLAEEAGAAIKAATAGKLSEETRAAYKKEFDELLEGVDTFAQAHARTLEQVKKEKGQVVEYDRMKVDGLVADAKRLAAEDRWQEANDTLRLAQREINAATNAMLHEKTVVYDKNFETPKEEYEYELGRFESYLELIPVAVEQRKPGKGALMLIERYRDKGVSLRDQAKERAAKGDYKNAILMLQAATANVRRGLRMAGVSM